MADDPRTEPRTSGMIALVPTAEDAERLAVDGGDDPDALHLTLVYLGDDVTGWDDTAVDKLTSDLDDATTGLSGPVSARVMGHAQFNPDTDPCAVYLVGDTGEVAPLRDRVLELLGLHGLPVAEQHTPFLPHVTAGFKLDPASLAEAGPVAFDRLRIALGDQEVDVPLGEALAELGEDYEQPEPVPVGDVEVKATEPGVETKVASPDPRAVKLRAYWSHGEGLKKWFRGLGVPGNFRRLRRHLAQYVHGERILNGLTANIYHEATGQWPGKRGHKSLVAAQFKSLWDDDVEAVADGDEAALCTGIEQWGSEFLDRADDVADPDGDEAGEPVMDELVETKAAPMVTIPAADLVDWYDDDDPDGVDRLLLDTDAAIIAGEQVVARDPDDEDWTEVAGRSQQYRIGGDAVLEPVSKAEATATQHAAPAALM